MQTKNLNINNFEKYDNQFNETTGIPELDKSAKIIQARLDEVTDSIVRNKKSGN